MTEREDRKSGYQDIRGSEGKKIDGGRGTREDKRWTRDERRQDIRTAGKQDIRKKEEGGRTRGSICCVD